MLVSIAAAQRKPRVFLSGGDEGREAMKGRRGMTREPPLRHYDQTAASTADAVSASPRDITIAVGALEDLFNAPPINPFTDRDLRALGEPALARAIREVQVGGVRDKRPIRLHIQVPPDHLGGDTGSACVGDAIRRYCAARIADNAERIRLTRRRARRGLQIAVALVLVFAVLAYLLLTTLLAHAGAVIQAIVVGSLSVFTWVVLWDTLEAWIFNPIAPGFENRALARLQRADVIVEVASP